MSKDYTKAIVKINRETKEGKIDWDIANVKPTSLSNSELQSGFVYEGKVMGRDVILYKYQYKYYMDEDIFHWLDGFRLDFVNERNISEWTFPHNSAIEDLYQTVQFNHANVAGFLEDYLEDEEDEKSSDF